MARKPRQNPLVDSAREAAREHIDGFERGIDRFSAVASDQLREGDPRTINVVRSGRRDIRDAREDLGFDE